MSATEWRAPGHDRHAPDIDYGMRWGDHRRIRVSFSPRRNDPDRGSLYAYDATTDRYSLLAADIHATEVDAAWRTTLAADPDPTDYLSFVQLATTGIQPTGSVPPHTPTTHDQTPPKPAPPADPPIEIRYLLGTGRGGTLTVPDIDSAVDAVTDLRWRGRQVGLAVTVVSVAQGEIEIPVSHPASRQEPALDLTGTANDAEKGVSL